MGRGKWGDGRWGKGGHYYRCDKIQVRRIRFLFAGKFCTMNGLVGHEWVFGVLGYFYRLEEERAVTNFAADNSAGDFSNCMYSYFKCAILIHSCLRVTLQSVVWIFDTFDKNLEMKNDFTKYLKESCW